ncbi:hypothetical protein ACJD0Z_15680 [Flavobacteriaceae bacterium M23B6Z8]
MNKSKLTFFKLISDRIASTAAFKLTGGEEDTDPRKKDKFQVKI